MKTSKQIFILTALLFCSAFAAAQIGVSEGAKPSASVSKGKYAIYYKGSNIGTYDVARETEGGKTVYAANSECSVRIFGTIKVSYNLRTVFENGQMIESKVTNYKNGKITGNTNTKWNGSGYDVDVDGEKSKISGPISKSSVMLYFDPPRGNEKFFSEKKGDMRQTSKLSGNSFLLALPNDDEGSHFYYNGHEVSKVDVPFVLGSFTIKRVAQF